MAAIPTPERFSVADVRYVGERDASLSEHG